MRYIRVLLLQPSHAEVHADSRPVMGPVHAAVSDRREGQLEFDY